MQSSADRMDETMHSSATNLNADKYDDKHGTYEAPPDLVELKLRSDTILCATPETRNPKP